MDINKILLIISYSSFNAYLNMTSSLRISLTSPNRVSFSSNLSHCDHNSTIALVSLCYNSPVSLCAGTTSCHGSIPVPPAQCLVHIRNTKLTGQSSPEEKHHFLNISGDVVSIDSPNILSYAKWNNFISIQSSSFLFSEKVWNASLENFRKSSR